MEKRVSEKLHFLRLQQRQRHRVLSRNLTQSKQCVGVLRQLQQKLKKSWKRSTGVGFHSKIPDLQTIQIDDLHTYLNSHLSSVRQEEARRSRKMTSSMPIQCFRSRRVSCHEHWANLGKLEIPELQTKLSSSLHKQTNRSLLLIFSKQYRMIWKNFLIYLQ